MNVENAHFILADSRSGSTLLQDHLNCHPDNTELGEVFGTNTLLPPGSGYKCEIGYLNCLFSKVATPHKGCKIIFGQLASRLSPIHFLLRYRTCKFILLERENVVQSAVSLLYAEKTGVYHSRGNTTGSGSIKVDAELLKLMIDTRATYKQLGLDCLRTIGANTMRLTYESMLEEPRRTVEKALAFLGLSPVDTASTLRKVTPSNLRGLIENYDEVRAAFAGRSDICFFE